MPNAPTIAALASAPGHGHRAVVRVSGADTLPLLARVLTTPPPSAPGPHAARLRLAPRLELPLLLLLARAPRSYTGEDTAELLIPGNPHLAERVVGALTEAGVAPAGPGEFTARAYLAGKLTLEQAEGVAALIAAARDEELATAEALLSGRVGERVRGWADRVATLLALVEAGIDFTDQEDVVAIDPAELRARAAAVAGEIAGHAGGPAEAAAAEPRIALTGPPNAGKSTLFNALLGRRRAAVADTPGTTRDVLDEPLDLAAEIPGAGVIRLLDLPGLERVLAGPADTAAQAAARAALERADALIACDPRGRFEEVAGDTRPIIRVLTKIDLPEIGHTPRADLAVCAIDGFNMHALRRAIADLAAAASGSTAAAPARHRAALAAAHTALRAVIEAPGETGPELLAAELRRALDELGSICGEIPPDEVIGRVFSTFCVGK